MQYRSRRSLHLAPERSTHRTAFTNNRLSAPVRAWIAGLARKHRLDAPPLPVRQFISLDHSPRSESVDPERNESELSAAENPECRLDLGSAAYASPAEAQPAPMIGPVPSIWS